MRIAVAGIAHETNTFSTLRTELADFTVLRGEEIVNGAFWNSYRSEGVNPVGLLTARAAPNGLVRRDAYLSLKEEILDRLEQTLPIDGIYLDLHGAMEVEGIGDGETDLIRALRDRVGPKIPLSASLDLHANLAPDVAETADVLTALRTAPHRDGVATRRRALSHLILVIREGLRPSSSLVKLPLLLPGEWAITEVEPARTFYRQLYKIESTPGILDASLLIGCAWTDSPFTAVSALVIAEEDVNLGRDEARRLAEAVWRERSTFGPEGETAPMDEAVSRALSATESTVFLSDAGDNITAGGAGDVPLILQALIEAQAPDAIVAGIADAEAVKRCARAGTGATVTLQVGGKLDRRNAGPLEITGMVTRLEPSENPQSAVCQVEGVSLVITADRRAFTSLASFEKVGIDVLSHKIVVVKQGYLFPELRDYAPRAIMALSPGFTDLRIETLPYRRIPRPMIPLDPEAEWMPEATIGGSDSQEEPPAE